MGCPNYAKHHPNASLDEYCEKFGYDKAKLSGAIKNTEKYREMKEKHSGKSDDEIVKQAAWEMDKSKSPDGKSLTDAVYNKSGNTGGSQNRESGQKQNNKRRTNFYSAGLEKRAADGAAGEKAEDKTMRYFDILFGKEQIETSSNSVKLEYSEILNRLAGHKTKSYAAREEICKMYEKVIYNFSEKYNLNFSEEELKKLSEEEIGFVAEVLEIIDKAGKDKNTNEPEKLGKEEAEFIFGVLKELKFDKKHAAYELVIGIIKEMMKKKVDKKDIVKKLAIFMTLIKGEADKKIISHIISPLERKLLVTEQQ